jgi:Zn-dependent protease
MKQGTNIAPSSSMIKGSGWKIGSFRGVDVRLHVTLLLILPYIVFVTYARFDALAQSAGVLPGELAFGPVGWGVLMAVLLFSSVLLHEFGHVLVALKQGARVRSITLMMLGGISDIDEIPEKPGQEFRLAVMGPVVSLVLAGIGFGIFRISANPNLSFVSLWFGQVNLVLAIFNLLPAFPLDGGRAFRSLMASRIGRLRATQVAARVGTGFAWVFGILGLLSFNIFLVLIAFFLYAAAQSELSIIVARSLLRGLHVGDVATTATSMMGSDTLESVSRHMLQTRMTLLPVRLSDGFALIALQQILTVPERFRSKVPVSDLLKNPVRLLDTGEALEDVLPEIISAPLGALPVSQSGSVIGFIRHSDLQDVLQLRSLEERRAEAA